MSASLARVISFNAVLLSCLSISIGGETSVRETPLVRAVRECRGAIVNIHTKKPAEGDRENRFFSRKDRKVTGMGTGIVVDERGFIATNYHVIHQVEKIIVTQEDGETYSARVIEVDRKNDLAIIRVFPTKPMKVMVMGTSSDVMLAEQVFAVGNAFGYEHTVTAGIVSAVSRDVEVDETQSYEDLIQTDASINPGNSGGPLLNLDGEIIGINVAIRVGAQRIGFAIPIDAARVVIADLLSRGAPKHGMVGTDVNTAKNQHLIVDSVVAGSPAAKSGLKVGDVVRKVRDVEVTDNADWERSLLELPRGEEVEISVDRDGGSVALQYKLGAGKVAASHVSARPVSTIALLAAAATPSQAAGIQRAWSRLGIKIAELSQPERRALPSRYNGGLKIVLVQSGSAGARHGLRNGDVLVGLDGFETLAAQSLEFILDETRLNKIGKLSFQIVRNGSQALVGSISLASKTRTVGNPRQSVRR
jgi:serine protease Do